MDIINEFHKQHRQDELIRDRPYRRPIPAIECNDGFRISVQASEGAYCAPRVTDDIEYHKFECGYPSAPVPILQEWKDGDGDDMSTVYGCVPVGVIVTLIESHGGIKGAFDHGTGESE